MDHNRTEETDNEWQIDSTLVSSCIGLNLKFPELWKTAEQYVKHGDDWHRHAGMKMIAEFADEMPLDEAATLLEAYFHRSNYAPVYGGKPTLDVEAFRAVVAIGLAADYMRPETAEHRRQRMTVVISQSILALQERSIRAFGDDPDEQALPSRAFRALIDKDPHWYEGGPVRGPGLIHGQRFDWELVEHCATAVEETRFDDAVRAAMIVLETRLRASTGEPLNVVGVDLVTKAFGVSALLNFGATSAEKDGLLAMFRGAFLLFRNPVAHRFIEHDRQRAMHVLTLVDLLLGLLSEANNRLYQPLQHLAPDEVVGEVRFETVLQVDFDGDSENERIVIYSNSDSKGFRTLHPLVLKQVSGKWRRVQYNGHFAGSERNLYPVFIDELSAIEIGDGIRRVLVRSHRRGSYGTVQVLEWKDGAVHPVGFVSSHIAHAANHDEMLTCYANSIPQTKDVDGDGISEMYVPESRTFFTDSHSEVVHYYDSLTWQPSARTRDQVESSHPGRRRPV